MWMRMASILDKLEEDVRSLIKVINEKRSAAGGRGCPIAGTSLGAEADLAGCC